MLVIALAAAPSSSAGGKAQPRESSSPPADLFQGFATGSRIDELVLAKLKKTGVPPSGKCSDEVFVRRVYLDVIGTLPAPGEVRNFLADPRPDKRARLIDALLARGEFADYWGLKWGDLLRVKSEFPCNLWPNAVQAYDRWIRSSIRDNLPYDRLARELLTASGSNFRVPQVNFYRAFQERTPRQLAESAALIFMGLRLQDAGWSEKQRLGFDAFFAKVGYKCTDEWKEEIIFFNPDGKLTDAQTNVLAIAPTPPGGRALRLAPDQDPRVAFADWLTAPKNPWFARNIVNRIWFWLLGRGIVHAPDDLRPANEPWSPKLLAYLEQELRAHGYDLKHIYRLILNSNTYQQDSRPNRWNAADEAGFSHYRARRLDAEPLLDAINSITGGGEKYTSAIPEPFTVLPNDQRAITLADGSLESPFLELFGRPPRNTSFESERITAPSALQAQHLLNSSHIERKIERSTALQQLAMGAAKPAKGKRPALIETREQPANSNLVEDLYIRILSRFPTAEERAVAQAYLNSTKRRPAESVCDIAWALINTKEFICRH
jgi:hypothetical protein